MKKHNTIMMILTVCFLVLQLIILIAIIKAHKKDYIWVNIVTIILFLIYTFIEVKTNLYIHNYARFIVLTTLLCNSIIGEYLGFYVKSFEFDKLLHLFGAYAATIFLYCLLNQVTCKSINSKIVEFIFIFSLGVFLGTSFELLEFLDDVIFKPRIPDQTNLFDTNLDLIFDMLGSLIAAINLTLTNYNLLNSNSSTNDD